MLLLGLWRNEVCFVWCFSLIDGRRSNCLRLRRKVLVSHWRACTLWERSPHTPEKSPHTWEHNMHIREDDSINRAQPWITRRDTRLPTKWAISSSPNSQKLHTPNCSISKICTVVICSPSKICTVVIFLDLSSPLDFAVSKWTKGLFVWRCFSGELWVLRIVYGEFQVLSRPELSNSLQNKQVPKAK